MFARDSGVPTSAPAILTPCLTCLRKQTDDEFLQFGRLEALDDGSLEFLVILVNYGLRLDPIRTESRRVLSSWMQNLKQSDRIVVQSRNIDFKLDP